MTSDHAIVQLVLRPGILDLGWGHPDPALLPLDGMRSAAIEAIERFGTDTLAYGSAAGAGPLIGWLRTRIALTEGRDPGSEGITITGGSSLGLDQVCTLLAQPGDVVLVESPTYHYAVRILRDHPFELVPVAADDNGLRIEAVEQALADVKRRGRKARMLYCVPTFNNPTGASLSMQRRRALIDLATREDLLILEDDVYRDLAYDSIAPPSLWSMDSSGIVLRLGSFAKSLAPGLRLGWLTGAPALIQRIAGGGVLDSGGGANHFTAMIVAAFCLAGRFEPQIERLRATYAERSSVLAASLRATLPQGCEVVVPRGGFFTWVRLRDGMQAEQLLMHAEAQGVAYIPGSRFYVHGGGTNTLRLAHSLYGTEDLIEAAARLGRALA
ncbi:MAG: PLP-dependent aminotransferase family protein [Roseiflexaceae bacterium]|nr:PLP-dependent aminotransferase family protein [Roseiflexaceae bacterium]